MRDDPFHELRPQLEEVGRALQDALVVHGEPARSMGEYFAGRLGQLLRPGLVLASSRLHSPDLPEAARDLAAMVELVHGASLLHDDVVDEAEVRRSQPTVFRRWGDRESVLLGDLFLSRALGFLAPHAQPAVLESVAAVTRDLAAGQLLELEAEGRVDLPVESYLRIIELKTATFFGHCARLGGIAGGASEEERAALLAFGTQLGFAYQILDDLLDVSADAEAFGKPVGADADNARLTLPVLRLLERAEDAGALRAALEAGDAARLAELPRRIRSSGAFEAVVADARGYTDAARAELDALPPSARLAPLRALLDYLFSRISRLTGEPTPSEESQSPAPASARKVETASA